MLLWLGYICICTASAAGLFEFLDTKKLNVGDDQHSDGDDGQCHDVLPQVPRRPVRNALLCQIFLSGDPFNNKRAVFHSLPEPNRAWPLVVYVFTPGHLLC